ncbi:oxidoreductase [Ameyamaea chiangmaiensis NBRC 103196]|uniref:SDR family NAD(P)-dependent oxidoreductase n=1 Tax=Ameyamaea chiangmaiensis TaxID=442969 RepID=A0A850P9U6_9PROT|nr:SDR family NAD(P)-dependent oxidoreductase [Ameyamaea chiangmaiensis]MBS4073646.1 SDR family NAD(P)-dependent oxidoreductase [Ameyamaea chiangmaiensis]NVN39086.1 SDR family NAD(P)-dependent oxidoreductase [Ameyamaea chiangmaiensis]GBQ68945.1 oxidoreductase [Ameyamaea chiangmaiensis NBRC 103196]
MPRPVTSGKLDPRFGRILITGASGGIGSALAVAMAQPGRTLVLWGRDMARLAQAAAECRARGATVVTRALDLRDGPAALEAVRGDDAGPAEGGGIDLAVLGAGVSDIRNPEEVIESPQTVFDTAVVNFATPAALATELAGRMAGRGGGHIVLIGSVAGFHDLPFATAYSGSKAGLARFAHALRLSIASRGVGVTLVAPGFVDTAMSRRLIGPRPFLVTSAKAARLIMRAVGDNRAEVVFPPVFRILNVIGTFLPRGARDTIMRRLKSRQTRLP